MSSYHSTTHSSSSLSRAAGLDEILAEEDADVQEREEEDLMGEIVMAVDLRVKDTVGCSYYLAREEKLYLMEDMKCGGLETIDACR